MRGVSATATETSSPQSPLGKEQQCNVSFAEYWFWPPSSWSPFLSPTPRGCSRVEKCTISGTITRDGKPLEWPNDQGHFLVIFVPEDRGPNDDPVLAESDRATGTYRIAEIKSGWYMVAIHQFDARHMDALQNKYDPVKTPLRYKVSDDGQVIDIDLPKELPR